MMSTDLRESPAFAGRQEDDAALDPRRRLMLLHECRDLVVARLSTFISGALEKIGAELAAAAMEATDYERQQALFSAVALVRDHRHDIEFRFRSLVVELFEQRLFESGSAAGRAPAPAAGELTLLDDQAVEDSIVLHRLARSARRQLDPDAVLGVRARLATLLDREWFDEDDYPASPELVFEALQHALDPLTTSAPVRTALLQAFEPWVTTSLAEMHVSINERLLGEQVLPAIRMRPVLHGPAAAGSLSAHRADAQVSGQVSGQAIGQAVDRSAGQALDGYAVRPGSALSGSASSSYGAAAMGRAGAVDRGGAVGTAGTLPGSAAAGAQHVAPPGAGRGTFAAQLSSGPAPHGSGDASPADFSHLFDDLVHSIPDDRAGVRRMAARALSDPGAFGASAAPMPVVETSLIDALHMLQSSSRDAADAGPLIARALEHAGEQGSPLDRLTVDIVSLVFDYIYADPRLPDPVKQQLLRLQVVAVKAALLDRSFFARRQHPMRRLIDRISALATDPEIDATDGAALVAGIVAVVDWILDCFDDDLAIFDEALARIDRLAQASEEQRASRLAELARQAEAAEALALARDQASRLLAEGIDGTTPAFLREFLDEWWSRVLARTQVDGACAGMDWPAAMRIAQTLVWSAAPKVPDEVVRLAACLPQMITALIASLQEVGMAETQRRQFFDELLRWHTQVIRDAKIGNRVRSPQRAAPSVADPGGGMPDPSSMAHGPGAGSEPAGSPAPTREIGATPVPRHTLVDTLSRGDLVELIDDDSVTQLVKLAWISPGRRVYILSRLPDFGRSFERAELVSWMACGRARRVEPHSAVDSAIDAIAATGAPATPPAHDEASPVADSGTLNCP